MGLDTSHDCWHGAYSAFHRWRHELARAAGLPPLSLMEGFYEPVGGRSDYSNPFYWARKGLNKDEGLPEEDSLPIKWDCLKPNALYELLNHSDCEGEIPWESCDAIADSLETLLTKLPKGEGGGHIGNWRDKTQKFIDGLRLAAKKKENVDFH